jgi:hypothetical protein
VWFCLLILAVGPLNVYADSIVWDFTVTHVLYDDINDPSTFTYQSGTFSLTQGRLPNSVSILDPTSQFPMFFNMEYFDVPYTMTTTKDGVLVPESSGIGTVTFWWDGIALPNGFHVFNADLSFDWHNLSPPEFQPGHYNSSTLIEYYDVVAETPEPSTLMLLGTGVLGGAAMMRRRLCRYVCSSLRNLH